MAYEHLGKTGTLWLVTKIKEALAGKVDAVSGKGLSTNDFTDDLKTTYNTAVSDVATLKTKGGEPNKINSISLNGTTITPDSSKNVALTTPTTESVKSQIEAYGYQTATQVDTAITGKGYQTAAQVDSTVTGKGYQTAAQVKTIVEGYEYQTADDVDTTITAKGYQTASNVKTTVEGYGYQTASQVNTAITAKGYQTSSQVQTAINDALSGITGIDIQVVTSLPTTGTKGVIYLVAHSHSDSGDNYDEYVWVTSKSAYEKIGNTDVDLSAYVKSADITDISETELKAMWES